MSTPTVYKDFLKMNFNIENTVYVLAAISLAIIFWIIHKMDQAVKK